MSVFNDPEDAKEARTIRDGLETELRRAENDRDAQGRRCERLKAKIAYIERFIELERKEGR